MSDNNNI